MCVNGPCSQGGTWPNYQRYHQSNETASANKTAAAAMPPRANLLQIHNDIVSKQKSKFIDGYDETNMEYSDDTDKQTQDKEIEDVVNAIHDPEQATQNITTLGQKAKMDYQKFVEDEFNRIEGVKNGSITA